MCHDVLWYLLWLTIILFLATSNDELIEAPYQSIGLDTLLLQGYGGHWLQSCNSFRCLCTYRLLSFRLAVFSARYKVPACWPMPSFRLNMECQLVGQCRLFGSPSFRLHMKCQLVGQCRLFGSPSFRLDMKCHHVGNCRHFGSPSFRLDSLH